MSKNKKYKGFTLTLPNGSIVQFSKSVFRPNQKSYDVMVNNGKDNCFYKVGIVRDINKLRELLGVDNGE